jgi:pyruvate carboxylase subunit A
VRIDGAIYKDYVIPDCYDSLIIKLIVTGSTWEETVARMKRSLNEFIIRGVKTTIPFHINIMNDEDFIKGDFDTGYIDRKPELMSYYEYGEPTDLVAAISASIAAHYGF